MKFRKLIAGALVVLGTTMGSGAWAATVVNLGFAIDHSGSISSSEFTLQQQGLANALALIPTDATVQYRISVVTFGADVKTLVPPTIVTSAADVTAIQTAITSHVRSNTGSTQTDDAINQLVAAFTPFDIAGTLTLFNISTDGVPTSQSDAVAAAAAAVLAGVDGISAELVGTFSQSQVNNLLAITSPNPIFVSNAADLPNPTVQGFVFGVSNFTDYQTAIGAKIQRIVDDTGGGTPVIPLPAAGWLLLGGMGALFGLRRRQKA